MSVSIWPTNRPDSVRYFPQARFWTVTRSEGRARVTWLLAIVANSRVDRAAVVSDIAILRQSIIFSVNADGCSDYWLNADAALPSELVQVGTSTSPGLCQRLIQSSMYETQPCNAGRGRPAKRPEILSPQTRPSEARQRQPVPCPDLEHPCATRPRSHVLMDSDTGRSGNWVSRSWDTLRE
jgi:hypothetical protein